MSVINHDPFDDPKALIEHARRHIADLERHSQAFFAANPYVFVSDIDAQTGEVIKRVRITEPLPKILALTVFDIVSELRAALDQAVYASAVAMGNPDPRGTRFPFADIVAQIERSLAAMLKGDAAHLAHFIRALQPYETGNPALWAMNKLRNKKLHRVLQPNFISGSTGMNPRFDKAPIAPDGTRVLKMGGRATIMSHWDAATGEYTYFKGDPEGEANCEFKVTFQVRLEEIPGLPRGPAASVLSDLSGIVERIVFGIEAETARLLAAKQKDSHAAPPAV